MKLKTIKKNYNNYNLYLIIDSSQATEEVKKFLKMIKANDFSEIFSLFANTKENNLPWDVAPLLLNFSSLENDEIEEIIEYWWKAKDILQFLVIEKEYPIKMLIKKLQNLLEIEMPDSTKVMFRWFDPRVSQNMKYLLEEKYLELIYKNVVYWGVKYVEPNLGRKNIKNLVYDYV